VADRYDRRLIGAICRAAQAVSSVVLALGNIGGWLTPGVIFVMVAVIGAARAFEDPTMSALMPTLVPRRELSRALVWYTTASQVARLSGPALGGLLLCSGRPPPTCSGGVAYLLATGLILTLRAQQVGPGFGRVDHAGLGLRRDGVHLEDAGHPGLDLAGSVRGAAGRGDGAATADLRPRHPTDRARGMGLGLLRSAPALGALGMSAVLALFPLRDRVGRLLFGR